MDRRDGDCDRCVRIVAFIFVCLFCARNLQSSLDGRSTWIDDGDGMHANTDLPVEELHSRGLRHRRCGWKGHGHAMRPCPDNDTYCGNWNGRFWSPIGCEYDDVRPHEAR
jgi:hypothetical protein